MSAINKTIFHTNSTVLILLTISFYYTFKSIFLEDNTFKFLLIADDTTEIVGIYYPYKVNGSHIAWSIETPLVWAGEYC